jgi:hypothetical protein
MWTARIDVDDAMTRESRIANIRVAKSPLIFRIQLLLPGRHTFVIYKLFEHRCASGMRAKTDTMPLLAQITF